MTNPTPEIEVEKVGEVSQGLQNHQCGSPDQSTLGATAALAWRPMDTAPKNGPDFLAKNAKGDIRRCWRAAPSSRTDEIRTFNQQRFAAVAWMPLPLEGQGAQAAQTTPAPKALTTLIASAPKLGATASKSSASGTEQVAAQVESEGSREELNTLLATLEARATAQAEEITDLKREVRDGDDGIAMLAKEREAALARATSTEAQIAALRDEHRAAETAADEWAKRFDEATTQITAQAETIQALKGTLEYVDDRLIELNVSNYDHDDVCRLNERSVEVILAIRHTLQDLSKALPSAPKGKGEA